MKRLSAFLLAAVLLCAGCSDKQDKFSDKRSEKVIAASADLYHEFDAGNKMVYPDYYAGRSFSEDGKKMFVYVTSAYNSELDFLAEQYDCVEFAEVRYGKNELNSYVEQYGEELAEDFPELEYGGPIVDEVGNCVIIQLDPETLENDYIMGRLNKHFEGRPVTFAEPRIAYLL